jgi:hypothetical protein
LIIRPSSIVYPKIVLAVADIVARQKTYGKPVFMSRQAGLDVADGQNTSQLPVCKQPKEGLANLPIEKNAQEAELNNLQDATTNAVSIMQGYVSSSTTSQMRFHPSTSYTDRGS